MDEPSDLTKAQRQRADALVIASRVLGRKPNLFGPQGVTEDRSTTDLVDLAQFILDGTQPLEGYMATLDTTEDPALSLPAQPARLRRVEDVPLPDDDGPSGE